MLIVALLVIFFVVIPACLFLNPRAPEDDHFDYR